MATTYNIEVPIGSMSMFAGQIAAPVGWLFCDGSSISRTTYSSLFSSIVQGVATFTVTIATPAVVTLAGHGFLSGDTAYLTTTGALPTGLSANTLYWVTRIDASSFNLSTTFANYVAGTKIATSGTQSGTHTAYRCPWGLGDGSTTFTLPDLRESAPVGIGTRGVGVSADTYTIGQFKDDQFQAYNRNIGFTTSNYLSNAYVAVGGTGSNAVKAQSPVGGEDRLITTDFTVNGSNGTPRYGTTTRGKRLGVNFIIKY